MWQYQNTDVLYHHGILGMRWGYRKDRLSYLKSKQQNMINNKQIGTNKYVKLSNKIYLKQQKEKLKAATNSIDKQNAKFNISEAKKIKKYGPDYADGGLFNQIYKVRKTTKDGNAVSIAGDNVVSNRNRVKKVLRKVGAIGFTVVTTSPLWYPAIKQGKDFVTNNKVKKMTYDWATGSINLYGIRK